MVGKGKQGAASSISAASTIKEPDQVDIILANNPGNFNRQRPITVDLTEQENLRRQLEQNHKEQLKELKQEKDYGSQLRMYRKGAFFSDKLLAMTLLNKNKNPNEISK